MPLVTKFIHTSKDAIKVMFTNCISHNITKTRHILRSKILLLATHTCYLQMKRRFLGNFIKMVDWEDWTSLSRHCHRVSLGVTWRPACMRQSPTWITVKTLAVNKMALDMLKHTGVETESLLCYVLTYLLKRCVTGRYI